MVANPERRTVLLDAAIDCLGSDGARGLTFRRVDTRAGLPKGTATNYFPSRAALLLAVAQRVFQRLTPDTARLQQIATSVAGVQAMEAYVGYVAERMLADPAVGLALVELRLEAARDATVGEVVGPFLRAGLADDQRFHVETGLPGGPEVVEFQHYAVLGLVLDKLTVPLNRERPATQAAAAMARALSTAAREG